MARVIWAPRALSDLEALLEYIARDAPASARRFGEKILSRIELLAEFPESGSLVPEDETETYREVFQGSYRIIFRGEKDLVIIVAIHHGARLLNTNELER